MEKNIGMDSARRGLMRQNPAFPKGLHGNGSEKVRVALMNYHESSNTATKTQELDLGYNGQVFQTRGRAMHVSGLGYNFRQEIAVAVNGRWLTYPANGSHNFSFRMRGATP